MRWSGEPEYPVHDAALHSYCDRLVKEGAECLGDRLVAILLCGSWARGEARPPESDVDLVLVVDTVDDDVLDILSSLWSSGTLGTVNLIGADEIPGMPRDGLEMFTTNARVLYGSNPFPRADLTDLAADLGRVSEAIARQARILALYPWLTETDRRVSLAWMTESKWGLRRALSCLVGLRLGEFPKTWADTAAAAADWTDAREALELVEAGAGAVDIARRASRLSSEWLAEAARAEQPPG